MIEQQTSHPRNPHRAVAEHRLWPWRYSPLIAGLTFATAAVWLLFGLWFKVLGMIPRHRLIIAAILGEASAGPLTLIVGVGEIALALWILTGLHPRLCAALQTLAIVTMNTLEITYAENLLLSPTLMICANAIFLGVVWYWALNTPRTRS